MKIRKAVIPAVGSGIRFLPATKAQPKEMLPIVDKPAIQYIVEEAVQSGIESILIVTGRNKKTIEDHFDKSVELEQSLLEKGNADLLLEIQNISNLANIFYIRQKEPLGLGHAILCAEQFIGDEPFAVLLGDNIMVSDPPALKQLMNIFETYETTVIGVQSVPPSEVSKYGIISAVTQHNMILQVGDLIEKPNPANAPSNIAIMGRYILKPSIFTYLKNQDKGAGNEYQLTDVLREVCQLEGLLGLNLKGDRYDIGDKFGYMKAIIEMGLQREELQPQLLEYMHMFDQRQGDVFSRRERDKRMRRKTCPDCGARAYSSCGGLHWECTICGKNLDEVPNDRNLWRHLVKVLETIPVQETSMIRKQS